MVRDHYLTFDSFPTRIISRFHLPLSWPKSDNDSKAEEEIGWASNIWGLVASLSKHTLDSNFLYIIVWRRITETIVDVKVRTVQGTKVSVGSATPAIFMCILLFILPQVTHNVSAMKHPAT